MAVSDLDQELDEMDVLKCAQISEVCESLAHSLQIIENPQMRYLLAAVSPKMARQKLRSNRTEGDEPVTYIVAPKLQAGMVKYFQGKYACRRVGVGCQSVEREMSHPHSGFLIHVGRWYCLCYKIICKIINSLRSSCGLDDLLKMAWCALNLEFVLIVLP